MPSLAKYDGLLHRIELVLEDTEADPRMLHLLDARVLVQLLRDCNEQLIVERIAQEAAYAFVNSTFRELAATAGIRLENPLEPGEPPRNYQLVEMLSAWIKERV